MKSFDTEVAVFRELADFCLAMSKVDYTLTDKMKSDYYRI